MSTPIRSGFHIGRKPGFSFATEKTYGLVWSEGYEAVICGLIWGRHGIFYVWRYA